jgi:hypothetical protein
MYVAKVKIGDIKVGDKVTESDIGKGFIESYLKQGFIAEDAKKAEDAKGK